MSDDLVLFAVAANANTEMWDGTKPTDGIMLRWLQRKVLEFPDWGYTVERAQVPDLTPLEWTNLVDRITGRTTYSFNSDVTMVCDEPFRFEPDGPSLALVVPETAELRFLFTKPFWWSVVRSADLGDLTVELRVGSATKSSDTLASDSTREWRVRGANELVVRGPGALRGVHYQLLDVTRKWETLAHICLPVAHPGYPCGPLTGSDESIAKARVPSDVDWGSRYSAGFGDLDLMLRAAATRSPSPTTFAPTTSTTGQRPSIQLDAEQAIAFATLDPHLARAVGVLYDDGLAPFGLDGRAWAYRVTGKWRGPGKKVFPTVSPFDALEQAGISLGSPSGRSKVSVVASADSVTISSKGGVRFEFQRQVRRIELVGTFDAKIGRKITWTATGGASSSTGSWSASKGNNTFVAALDDGQLIETLELSGPFRITVDQLQTTAQFVERASLIPWVEATVGSGPLAPAWITADVSTPAGGGGETQAALRWDPDSGADSFTGGTVLYQVAASNVSRDPTTAQPTAAPFDTRDLLFEGAPLTLPAGARATPRPLYALDRPLVEGWRAWWVRGVDLFGRVSAASPPVLRSIVDDQPGPPPRMLRAEYAQAGLDASVASMMGQSTTAAEWLGVNPTTSAVMCEWAWTPELDQQCGDVDAFRLYVRRPASDGTYSGQPWGAAIASVGPIPVRYAGTINGVDTTLADTTITSSVALDSTSTGCQTTLRIDIAGALIGAVLRIGTRNYPIVGHSEGANVRIVVTNPSGMPPAAGVASVRQGSNSYVRIRTGITVASLSSNPHRVRFAGALRVGSQSLLVAAIDGSDFIARRLVDPTTGNPLGPLPVVGDAVTWYPYYRFVVADTGFGPSTSATVSVADAEVSVTSVRRVALRPAESSPASPATIHAVDATPPLPPTVPAVPSGPYCAELATAADWYGKSRYQYRWNTVANVQGFIVHRAMHDAIRRADQALHLNGGVVTAHSFSNGQLPSDPTRRATVLADLATLDAALQNGGNETITNAYSALRADTWQVLASQERVASAFTALHGAPLAPSVTSFDDTFDGRTGAHWFYRVLAISNGGVKGPLSPSTPPICAPKVTAPEPPKALLALAGVNSVQLKFARSASADVARYRVYRTHDPIQAKDTATMYVQATLTPSNTATHTWTDANATGGREWFYRIVAEDANGNRSLPSDIFAAHSLVDRPIPPTWMPFTRNATSVLLQWQHPQGRSASLIESRTGSGPWRSIASGWQPRGVFALEVFDADVIEAVSYRIRVRNGANIESETSSSLSVPGRTLP